MKRIISRLTVVYPFPWSRYVAYVASLDPTPPAAGEYGTYCFLVSFSLSLVFFFSSYHYYFFFVSPRIRIL